MCEVSALHCCMCCERITAILSAFFALRILSIPSGMVVPAAQLTIAAGWVSGPVMWVASTPRRLSAFLSEVDLPKVEQIEVLCLKDQKHRKLTLYTQSFLKIVACNYLSQVLSCSRA